MLNLPKTKKYLLACSYGPDSMALFDMLIKEKYSFEVAHVNYDLRDEAINETNALIKYCNEKNVLLHIKQIHGLRNENNLEEKCREIRYKFFQELTFKNSYDAVLVAHHQDDFIETYLLQLKRDNLVTYFGIKKETQIQGVKIVRPLLDFSKETLLQYCQENHVPFMVDSSNLKDEFLRNQIRHEIVEKMTNKERAEILQKIQQNNNNLTKLLVKIKSINLENVDELLKLEDKEFCYAINAIVNNIGISKKFCLEIRKVLLSKKPNILLQISPDLFLEKAYRKLSIKTYEINESYSYLLSHPKKLDTPYFYLDFSRDGSNRNVTLDSYPITIRNAKPKDLVAIKDYYVEVRRLFIDWKMPASLRKQWPVILDRTGSIIYIPRYQSDFEITDDCNFYVKERFYLNK